MNMLLATWAMQAGWRLKCPSPPCTCSILAALLPCPAPHSQVALVGAPNVGKSSLVQLLSSGLPEVQNYPFTTRSIKMGHFYVAGRRHQVTGAFGVRCSWLRSGECGVCRAVTLGFLLRLIASPCGLVAHWRLGLVAVYLLVTRRRRMSNSSQPFADP